MTAFPDQPWSRRPERSGGPERSGVDAQGQDPQARDAQDRDAQGPASDGRPPARRMTPLSPGAPAEPLIYQTQQRVPGEQGGFRPRRPQAERVDDDALPPTQALPAQDAPQYRRRDFSPEGRRSVPSWAPAYAQGDGGYPTSERLDYQTLGHQEVRAAVERSRGSRPEGPADAAPADAAPADAASASPAAAASPPADSTPPVTGAIPMSTADQPLTRRQLRALREQQEREEQERAGAATPETAPASEPDSRSEDSRSEDDRPTARPWAPVFYGDQNPAGQAPEPETPTAAAEAPAAEPSAPATFAVPVITPDAAAADAAARAAAPSRDDVPAGESLDDWMAKVFEGEGSAAPEPAPTPADAARADSAPPVAGDVPADAPVEPSEESAAPAADPVALVEPPEPSRWEPGSGEQPGSPAVLDALFAPPAQAEPAPAAADPLAFLGAQPAPSERVDLPAPGAWSPEQPDAASAEAASAAADPTAEEIVVEEEPAGSGAADDEVHPVVVDAQPLSAEPIASGPASGEVPTGHWTQQAAAGDEQTVSRDVGGGHGVVTTNALVLPSIPQPELAGPLTNTGEILVTGSIDLPRSLSSTGAHPTQLDESSLDHELDPGDQQVVSADSQPIRAIRAVSTHTSTRGMMLNTKPKGNRSLTVLIVVTAALAVGVGVVLVVGLLNNAF